MVLRLNRPDRLNAIDFGLVGELHDRLDQVAANDSCKVAILTPGHGEGFCAGLDLKDYGAPPEPGQHRHFPAGQAANFLASLTEHLRATPQIMLAMINGPAYGGGLSLSLACDLRIAAASATFWRSSAPASPAPTPGSAISSPASSERREPST